MIRSHNAKHTDPLIAPHTSGSASSSAKKTLIARFQLPNTINVHFTFFADDVEIRLSLASFSPFCGVIITIV